ncbi:sodium:alanine symporter family protein, partial [Turicibacter sanguinis]|nr:sodium:alanine symporter family protein [Turicibacter sanguinis]
METIQTMGNSILDGLNNLISAGNTYIGSYLLIVLLLIAGFYFSFRTGFVQFRMMKEMIRLLGDGVGKSNKNEDKISSFQAFCISTARSGTNT